MADTQVRTGEQNIFGIVRVDMEFLQEGGAAATDKKFAYLEQVDDTASITPNITEGNEVELKTWNHPIAKAKEEDDLKNIDVALTHAGIPMKLMDDLYGGTVVEGGTAPNYTYTYTPPMRNGVVTKQPFKMTIWSTKRDTAGNITGYTKFIFPYCKAKGRIPTLTVSSSDFTKPEFTITAEDNISQSLPAVYLETALVLTAKEGTAEV